MNEPQRVYDADFRVNPETGVPERAPSRTASRVRRFLGPLLVLIGILAKIKWIVIPLQFLKGLPFLAPTLTALVSIGAYALAFGWQFGIGLVAMIFIHEMGHVAVLRRYGIRASAPIFIPFLGAIIGMRQLPRDAVMEAYVGLGGPVLGSIGAFAALGIYFVDGHPIWLALAYIGILLNLFNLLPLLPLDGGRVVGAVSQWMWGLGVVGLIAFMIFRPTPILILILVFAAMEFIQVFRRRRINPEYYQVPVRQRATIAAVYFGLVVILGLSMHELNLVMQGLRVI
ncbi:site-2 protease family protein [Nitrolancea hollandica]|uniref:Peptidase M50 n=1 Tax=Nitrolancea hollandica Lb TaxID=1129897 RepID=I4EDJ9_9BACT|nr:site-2 protease family protein [Nitrolancea hollandica]CCF82761.1 Peptidase M50 [Nitrolancea hollandica Lb]